MILILIPVIFIFVIIGFCIDTYFSKPKMHPAGYVMVPKKELKRREEAAMRDAEYEAQLDAWKAGRDYIPRTNYSEQQQYMRELLEQQNEMIRSNQSDYYRQQQELSNERFLHDLRTDYDTFMDNLCQGTLDLFRP